MSDNNTQLNEERLEPCKWCEQGDRPKFLDQDGTLVSITGNDGILSHAHEEYWWPCLKFGVEIHCSRAVAAPQGELELLLQRVSELTLDEGYSSHYQHGFEMFRDKMTAVLKARLAVAASPPVSPSLKVEEVAAVDGRVSAAVERMDASQRVDAATMQIQFNPTATPVPPSDAVRKLAEEMAALKRPPSQQFSVRFVDHIQGSNCAQWKCGKCKLSFVSAGMLECPHCHDNELEPKITDADAIYNQAIEDAAAIISRHLTATVVVGDETNERV